MVAFLQSLVWVGHPTLNTPERQERRAAELAEAVRTYYRCRGTVRNSDALRAKAAARGLLRHYRHPAGVRDDWDWRGGRVEFMDVPTE